MADRYWVGGSENWDATAGVKWATTSGGAGGAPVPTSADNVFFDANSGAGPIYPRDNIYCNNLDCTGFTGEIRQFLFAQLWLSGSLKFVPGMTFSNVGTTALKFFLLGAGSLDFGGKTIEGIISIQPGATSYSLANGINSLSYINQKSGTFTTNNYPITCLAFFGENSGRTLNFGTSIITITGTFSRSVALGGPFFVTVAATDYTFVLAGTTTQEILFNGGTFNRIRIDNPSTVVFDNGGQPNYSILELVNTVQPTTLKFESSRRLTVNTFNVSGTPGNLVTLNSITPGSRFEINKTSGAVNVEYLNIQDSNATGGATWVAAYSVDSGNNIGWTFVTPVVAALTGVETTGFVGEFGLVELSGVQSLSTFGSIAIEKDAAISSTVSTGEIGVLTAITGFIGELSGVATTANVSSLGVTHDGLQLSQVFNVGQIGSVVATVVEETVPVGVQASGQAGSILYTTSRAVSNTSATGEVGEFGVFNGIIVAVSGVQTNGAVGSFSIPWYPMSTAQTANWGNIGTAQTASWTNIN